MSKDFNELKQQAMYLGQSAPGKGNRPQDRSTLLSFRDNKKPLCPEQNECSSKKEKNIEHIFLTVPPKTSIVIQLLNLQ